MQAGGGKRANAGYRWSGISRIASVRAAAERWPRGYLPRQFLQRQTRQHQPSASANRNFELVRHDIVEPILLEVDRIFHLACPASPVHYQYNPVKTIKTSVMGTINMLGLAKRVHARILLTSTSEVYGDPEQHPQTESYWGHVNPIGVRSCYDEGKRVAECLMMDYHRQNNIDITIVRIFNTYGPRMAIDDGRVVSNFCVAALRGEDLPIYGDGKQTRSFAYVDDIIDAIVRMMDSDGGFTGPVNIGNPDEFTILELASLAVEYRGRLIEARVPSGAGPTIRCGANPISLLRASNSNGSRRLRCKPASRLRWIISAASWDW